MKRNLSLLWVFLSLVINAMAYDFQAVNDDGKTIYYNILNATAVEVTSNVDDLYTGIINIPGTVTAASTTYTVNGIAGSAFENCVGLTEVTIPTSVNSVGDYAFRGCSNLASITFPNVMVTYGMNILENCTSLTSFDVPQYMTTIPVGFFKGCTGLTTVTMTNHLLSISWSAFEGCTALSSDTFSIPSSVISINYSAFKGCTSLSTITIPEGITKLENNTFEGCTGLIQVTLPSTLTEIKAHVFRNCNSLTLINFPENLRTIGVYAFNGCANLMNINMSGSQINSIDDYAFEDCIKLTNLTLSDSLTYLGNHAFQNCEELRLVEFPRTYTSIGARTFVGCSKLLEVVMPSTTASIGSEAFKDCIRLATVRCHAMTPPAAGNNNCFSGVLASLTFHVPCDAVDAYLAQAPYNQFNVDCDPNINITTDVMPFDCGYVIGDGFYTTDETVNLIAVPRNHYVFHSWTENDSVVSTDSIYSFTATHDREIIANFVHGRHTITATAYPASYGHVTGGGIYEYSAVARLMAYPNEHYEFFFWTEHDSVVSTNTIYRFTVPYDRDLVAHFSPLSYQIITRPSDSLAGTTSGDGVYVYNDTVNVSATVNEHYNFHGWKEYGQIVSPDTVYTFQAERNRTLTAYYIPDEHQINVTVNIPGAGTIDGAGMHYYNSIANLVATSAQHYTFRTWTENGATVSADSLYSFIVTGDRDLVANFTLNSYNVTTATNIPDVGVTTGDGTYLCGDQVTVTAQANLHATFLNWTIGNEIVSTDAEYTFIIDGNTHLVANFEVEDGHHWTPNITPYPHTMMLTSVIQIDGVEQFSDALEVGAFCDDVVRGSQKAQLVSNTGRYLVYMTIYGYNNEVITFRLYDHNTEEELNLACITHVTMLQDQIIGSTADPFALNFISSLFITAIASPEEGGTVMGGGPYDPGDSVFMNATPSLGYSFYNWTEGDLIVSTNASFSFVINESRTLTANFVQGNHWTPDPGPYTNVMDITCVIEILGTEQRSDMLEIGAFCGNVVRGSQRAEYVAEVDRYIAFMTIGGAANEEITFRLYDHATGNESNYISEEVVTFTPNMVLGSVNDPFVINFVPAITITTIVSPSFAGTVTGGGIYPYGSEVTLTGTGIGDYVFVNWTINGNVVSSIPVYTFPATQSLVITGNFEYGQSTHLSTEWNWYSTFIEMNGMDGLGMIKDMLIGNASIIKSKTEYIEYSDNEWHGTLTNVTNEQMYQIYMNNEYTLGIYGDIADPNDHPITLLPDVNWIGYPVNMSLDINDALAGLNAVEGDFVQSQECYAEYNDGIGWIGSLTTLEPGQGYMYGNSSNVTKTFVYQTTGKREFTANRTTRNNFWQPNVHKYANNMCVTSSIMLQDYDVTDGQYEIGAFCNGECRGSARPIYIEQLDKYITYLTVYGDEGDEITFKLYDTEAEVVVSEFADNTISFNGSSMVGTSNETFEIEYNEILNIGENNDNISIYPNPVNQGDGIVLSTNCDNSRAMIFNALGVLIYEKTFDATTVINCLNKAGVYFIQVMTADGKAYKKVVVK